MTRRERIEQRILGAVRFVDVVTGLTINAALTVSGARMGRGRGATYLLLGPLDGLPPELQAYTESFRDPPADPPPGSVILDLTVHDPSGMYLDRRFRVRLPLQSGEPDAADYLFEPLPIRLYPAPDARLFQNWAVIRAHLHRQDSDAPLAGALLRVTRRDDHSLIGQGLSDARGEALIAIAGLALQQPGGDGGAVLTSEYAVTLEARVDPARQGAPDPDVLAETAGLPAHQLDLTLTPGKALVVDVPIAVP